MGQTTFDVPAGKVNGDVTALSNSIGTVPTGETVEGQITALNAKAAKIGTVVSDSGTAENINANNNTAYANCSITLSPGTWIVIGHCLIPKSVNGSRQGMTVTTSNTAGSYNIDFYDLKYQSETLTLNQYYSVAGMAFPSTDTTYYAMFFNGNTTVTVQSSLYAVRIA